MVFYCGFFLCFFCGVFIFKNINICVSSCSNGGSDSEFGLFLYDYLFVSTNER